MGKRTAIVITIFAAILAIAGPIFLATYIANRQANEMEKQRALFYARVVLARSERTADQIDAAVQKLVAAHARDPCSEASLEMMRNIDLTHSHMQAIGHMSGNRLDCSSLGRETSPHDLGPPDLITPAGVRLWTNVAFPGADGDRFLVIEHDNFAAIIHNSRPIELTTASKDVSVATFSVPNQKILTSRGVVNPAWITALDGRHEVTFMNDDHIVSVVAVLRSGRYFIGALCALPASEVRQRVLSTALVLVPVGIAGALLLLLVVFNVAKFLVSIPSLINGGLKRNEFFLNYQPVVDLQTGKWVGAEALLRWSQPEGRHLRPEIFIPIAEDSGLIQRVTERVLEIISRDAATVFQRYPDFHIAINLTSDDLHSTRTIERLNRLVEEAGARPGNLMIEATERSLMDPRLADKIIRELRVKGYSLAIDDFGIGYSSLSYLGTFEFDLLKIDKSFVEALDTGSATSQVVPHIIEMAKSMNLKMIAEGVETEAQAQYLRERGVQFAQGWLFAKAMPLAELLARLEQMDQNLALDSANR